MRDTQWYPGTMSRALSRLQEDLRVVDLVVELIDARAPASSRNPELVRLSKNKQRLTLLHKADRGEEAVNSRWLLYFQKQGLPAMLSSVQTPRSLNSFLG
ncbi:MAG: ribosome biogenesis GTPase YlqF, partial [Dethiobacteria bacterium]